MSQPDRRIPRREFLKLAVAASSAAALFASVSHADDLPPLAESDPTATALGYKDDGAKVDAAKFPQHKAGQTCQTCNFFQGSAARGGCTLFPGKSVAAKGWCSAFAAKPA